MDLEVLVNAAPEGGPQWTDVDADCRMLEASGLWISALSLLPSSDQGGEAVSYEAQVQPSDPDEARRLPRVSVVIGSATDEFNPIAPSPSTCAAECVPWADPMPSASCRIPRSGTAQGLLGRPSPRLWGSGGIKMPQGGHVQSRQGQAADPLDESPCLASCHRSLLTSSCMSMQAPWTHSERQAESGPENVPGVYALRRQSSLRASLGRLLQKVARHRRHESVGAPDICPVEVTSEGASTKMGGSSNRKGSKWGEQQVLPRMGQEPCADDLWDAPWEGLALGRSYTLGDRYAHSSRLGSTSRVPQEEQHKEGLTLGRSRTLRDHCSRRLGAMERPISSLGEACLERTWSLTREETPRGVAHTGIDKLSIDIKRMGMDTELEVECAEGHLWPCGWETGARVTRGPTCDSWDSSGALGAACNDTCGRPSSHLKGIPSPGGYEGGLKVECVEADVSTRSGSPLGRRALLEMSKRMKLGSSAQELQDIMSRSSSGPCNTTTDDLSSRRSLSWGGIGQCSSNAANVMADKRLTGHAGSTSSMPAAATRRSCMHMADKNLGESNKTSTKLIKAPAADVEDMGITMSGCVNLWGPKSGKPISSTHAVPATDAELLPATGDVPGGAGRPNPKSPSAPTTSKGSVFLFHGNPRSNKLERAGRQLPNKLENLSDMNLMEQWRSLDFRSRSRETGNHTADICT